MKTGIASILLVGFFLIGIKKMKQEEMDASELLIHFTDLILVVLYMIAVFLFIFGLCVSTKSLFRGRQADHGWRVHSSLLVARRGSGHAPSFEHRGL